MTDTIDEIQQRFLAGVQLAQQHGAGSGEYRPEGAEVDAATGEISARSRESAAPPAEPAAVVESAPQTPPEEVSEPPEAKSLAAIARYVDRQLKQVRGG